MILPILEYGDPALRAKGERIEKSMRESGSWR